MAKDTPPTSPSSFSAALAGFRRWTKTTERKLAGEPGADVEELLLGVYPRKIAVLDRADTQDTIPAVRDFLAYLGFELADDELAWMLTDSLVVDGWDDVDGDVGYEPADLAEQPREAIPAGRELATFEMMARIPRPDAATVLTVIGRQHPDKKIAKIARKSAYKAASRHTARQ